MAETGRILIGDVREQLRTLPSASVHCVVTSPPYWGLRDYGVPGQLGLEPTPDEHVAAMVDVFCEVRRVLRDDGTAWVNYGDSYAASGPAGGDGKQHTNAGSVNVPVRRPTNGLKPKDLVGMPWRVAFGLQADGWYLRSDIIWAKPNPMPESVTDRCTKAHEYIFLLSKSPRYYYDADAVREKLQTALHAPGNVKLDESRNDGDRMGKVWGNPLGRNRRSVWTIATAPYPGAHFATFPPELIRPCIRAGTSEKGCCPECGAPWVREVERAPMVINRSTRTHSKGHTRPSGTMVAPARAYTVGWSPSCECAAADPVPCTVLDPFFGSGTTGLVCDQEGRDWLGIELNPEYAEIARRRLNEKQEALF